MTSDTSDTATTGPMAQGVPGNRPALKPLYKPSACPHCEYDRRFPGFEGGGWIQQSNNGPIVSCPMCNDDGSHLPLGGKGVL